MYSLIPLRISPVPPPKLESILFGLSKVGIILSEDRDPLMSFGVLKFFYLFYFWLCWVFVAARGLSLVSASGGYSSLQCTGFSL